MIEAYQEIAAYLDEHLPLRFPDDPEQKRRDAKSIAYHAPFLAAQKKAYGNDFQPFGKDMELPALRSGALAVCFEALRSGIGSSTRGPVGTASVAALSLLKSVVRKNYELVGLVDITLIAGVIAGISSFMTEKTVLALLDLIAFYGNAPTMFPINLNLFPPPCPDATMVISEIEGRRVREYHVPATELTTAADASSRSVELAGQPTLRDLQQKEGDKKRGGALRQLPANDDSLTKPLWSGGFQVARRSMSAEAWLKVPEIILGTAMLFSFLSAFVSKALSELLKLTPLFGQLKVDDFVGGQVRRNLFVVKGRSGVSSDTIAKWSDYPQLPTAVWNARKAVPRLLLESVRHPRMPFDLLGRHVVPNATASLIAPLASLALVDTLRPTPADPNESLLSKYFKEEQLANSALNELINKLVQGRFDFLQVNVAQEYLARDARKKAVGLYGA